MSKTSCKSLHREAGTSECLTFCFKNDELMTTKAFCLESRAYREAWGCHKEKALHPAAFFFFMELKISELFRQALRLSQLLLLRQIITCYVRHSSPSWYQRRRGAACSGHHDRERELKSQWIKKVLYHLHIHWLWPEQLCLQGVKRAFRVFNSHPHHIFLSPHNLIHTVCLDICRLFPAQA